MSPARAKHSYPVQGRSDRSTALRRKQGLAETLVPAPLTSLKPWASPVAYVVYNDLDFHWASLPDATHSRNLEGRSRAAIAIFDSRATYEEVDGLQAEGAVSEVGAAEAEEVHRLYVQRYPMYVDMPASYLGRGRFRFYRFRPRNVYVLTIIKRGGDARRSVDIVELKPDD